MIKKLDISDNKNIAFKLSAKIELDGERDLIAEMQKAVDENNKINVMFIVEEHINEVLKESMEEIKWISKHTKNIDKIAIVAEGSFWKWLITVDLFFAKFVGVNEKYFEDKDDAWEWIKE